MATCATLAALMASKSATSCRPSRSAAGRGSSTPGGTLVVARRRRRADRRRVSRQRDVRRQYSTVSFPVLPGRSASAYSSVQGGGLFATELSSAICDCGHGEEAVWRRARRCCTAGTPERRLWRRPVKASVGTATDRTGQSEQQLPRRVTRLRPGVHGSLLVHSARRPSTRRRSAAVSPRRAASSGGAHRAPARSPASNCCVRVDEAVVELRGGSPVTATSIGWCSTVFCARGARRPAGPAARPDTD